MRAALLCHGMFGPLTSKTAACILRYPRTYETVAVIDGSKAGRDASEFVGDIGRGVPVVRDLAAALAFRPEALVVGIAPRGGALPAEWRADLRLALERGLEVHSGLHTLMGDDPELAALAQKNNGRIWDVRRPTRPARIATGEGRNVDALVVHTMGTDCNVGKMTTTVELVEAAKRRGIHAAFAATGQTGLMVGCDAGAPIDRVISDFVAGAAEELVLECDRKRFELVAVEGQGSLTHPAYSGVTLGLAHGAFPDLVVLCHQPSRRHHLGYEKAPHEFPLLDLRESIQLIESVLRPISGARVAAVSLMTVDLDEAAARRAIEDARRETGLPATDPIRFGADALVDAVASAAQKINKKGAKRVCASKPIVSP